MAQLSPTDPKISSHPVLHTSTSGRTQPSLLPSMLNQDGFTQGRSMGTQILCTDCHNSDDNREFGGTGPNGPHGSQWHHILEHRYEFTQAPKPGLPVTALYLENDLSVNGPYGMCAKCHNLSTVKSAASWAGHVNHLNDGFTCSVCHTAHGMGVAGGSITGERLVDFDVNVVASNGVDPISYNHATNTCALLCHGVTHLSNGTVTQANLRTGAGAAK